MVAGDSSSPEARDSVSRADRLALGDVALDQRFQQQLGAVVEHGGTG
jgi:hypothetical protein